MLQTSTKIVVILQLCLVFSVLMWTLAGPFSAEYFTTQSSRLMHQAVIGNVDGDAKQQRIFELFAKLSAEQQMEILDSYQKMQQRSDKGFWVRSGEAVAALLIHLPPFTQAWIFFSLCICIMLLLRIEGAALAAWLLPLIALVYGIDNRLSGDNRGHSFDGDLFPSEEYLVERYLGQPLTGSMNEQHQQLMSSWQRYLTVEWAHQEPSDDSATLTAQAEIGEHAFDVARLQRHITAEQQPPSRQGFAQKPMALLVVYVLWNLFFAYYVKSSRCA
ncbi:MAG: hypothetical protein E6Q59_05165 [Nitrosomonas sp.]|nr:MAG: hypothetical protein E6Q59_05165 [Nitrosomonas sp.]